MLKWLATAKKQDRTDLESENDAVSELEICLPWIISSLLVV
jgi:hypothetical protein